MKEKIDNHAKGVIHERVSPSEIRFAVLGPQLNMLRPDEICLPFHGAGI